MDGTEQYILKELAYSAERSTWFELNGQYAITLQDILTRKDAEIERLRGALHSIKKVPNSEAAYGIIQVFVDDALKEKE